MMSRQQRFFRLTGYLALMLTLGWFMPGPLVRTALAQGTGDLARAREHVDFAEYDQALTILEPLIASGGLSGTALRDAYVLQARSRVGLGDNAAASAAFCSALQIDPQWQPDQVVYTQDEIAVFAAAKANCGQAAATPPPAAQKSGTPFYKKPVAWIVAGVVLIGGVILASGGGGDDAKPADPIGDPPPPPTGK